MFRHPGLFAVRLMAVRLRCWLSGFGVGCLAFAIRLMAVWLFAVRPMAVWLLADGGLAEGCLASGGILCGLLSCQVEPAQHKASHVPPSPARFNRCPERRAALVEA